MYKNLKIYNFNSRRQRKKNEKIKFYIYHMIYETNKGKKKLLFSKNTAGIFIARKQILKKCLDCIPFCIVSMGYKMSVH